MIEKIKKILEENGIDLNFVPNLVGDLEFSFNIYSSTDTNSEVLRLKEALKRKNAELIELREKKPATGLVVSQDHLKPKDERLPYVTNNALVESAEQKFTLEEALALERELTFSGPVFSAGSKCRVCTQFVKLYKRTINKSMATELKTLYIKSKEQPDKVWFHAIQDLHRQANASGIDKLRHWGLVEEKGDGNSDTGGKRGGFWRILPKGIAFIEGRERVPKYVKIFDAAFYGFDEESGTISISDCMKESFNYQELMSH